jgi:hypothetical protein
MTTVAYLKARARELLSLADTATDQHIAGALRAVAAEFEIEARDEAEHGPACSDASCAQSQTASSSAREGSSQKHPPQAGQGRCCDASPHTITPGLAIRAQPGYARTPVR